MQINRVSGLGFGTKISEATRKNLSEEEFHYYTSAIENSPLLSKLDDSYELSITDGYLHNPKNRYVNISISKTMGKNTLRTILDKLIYGSRANASIGQTQDRQTKSKYGTRNEGIYFLICKTSDEIETGDKLRRGFLVDALSKLNVRAAVEAYNEIDKELP